MRRYLIVSLTIALAVSLAMLLLVRAGLFDGVGESLGRFYQMTGWLDQSSTRPESGWGLLVMVLAALLASWCGVDIPRTGQKMLVFVGMVAVVLLMSPTLALYGVVFEPLSSAGAICLATVAAFLYSRTERGMRKRLLLDVLGTRVSRQTFDQLLAAREPIQFQGSTRVVSILTCRVFNHAELREKMEPAELVAMGNLFLRNTADFLIQRGGYLDESSPDLVRVFFGLVRPGDSHAHDACVAALELRTRLRNLNEECETRWFRKLDHGIAISSGPMTVGVYGSARHFYFSGVGADTDFSRRLAQGNARYGSDILISARTHQLVKDAAAVRPMEMLYDPERNLMTEVYELLAMTSSFSEDDAARRDAFWRGVIYYRSGKFEEALERFSAARVRGKEDGPVSFFIERCQSRLTGAGNASDEGRHELTDEGHARLMNMM